jgi:hypothetical protein
MTDDERSAAVSRMQDIKGMLTEFHCAETGRALRKELHELAKSVYVPQHRNDEYIEWIQEMLPQFGECSPQSTNHPFYMQMFSVASQHVCGNTIQECLDSAMKCSGSAFKTRDGVFLKIGDNVSVWIPSGGIHTLESGVVQELGVITWCGSGVGHVRYDGFSTREAAVAAGCNCTKVGKPCCKVT